MRHHSEFAGQTVLVTGASGFIGWHVAQKLLSAGARVRALARPAAMARMERPDGAGIEWLQGDLLRRDSVDAAVNGCRFVFHVAGDYRFWAPDPREIFAGNVTSTCHLLDAARAADVEKIVCTSTTGILSQGTPECPADERRLASPAELSGPYKRAKFAAFCEADSRAQRGWPIVFVLPTAPIGPRDLRPTPTGRIVVEFLNGRIPLLARTGLNFVDVRDVAAGHLLAMQRGGAGERYLLGGTNLRLVEFFEKLAPLGRRRVPRRYAPHWMSCLAACASEAAATLWTGREPFVTRESVKMSRAPHFSGNHKAEAELGYVSSGLDKAIADAVRWFGENGMLKQRPPDAMPAADWRRAGQSPARHLPLRRTQG